jgi:hypothetical protein
MAADSNEIVYRRERVQEQFAALTQLVTGPEARTATAGEMELRLFQALLELGRQLLVLFFATRASIRPQTPMAADGTRLEECRQRRKTYLSVFGKICFERHRFFARGRQAVSPLDAELSLPERCYSPLLRDWAGHELAEAPYDSSAQILERILNLRLSKNALETLVGEDAREVDAFYEEKPLPASEAEGPILVAQADGAGVRLVGSGPSERTGHQTSKREAVVTGVYSIQPYRRNREAVVEALLHTPGTDANEAPRPRRARPKPIGKELRASLDGKDDAIRRLSQRIDRRDGPHIQHRVAITDGDEALREHLAAALPGFTLVLDIMHVLSYLRDAVKALHGGWTSSRSDDDLRAQLETLLAGQTQAVIDDLLARADASGLEAHRRKPIDDAVRYFRNHADSMRYDLYLSHGWPIASGVIEGACKHVVRGRLDRSGMKWTREGAHAMLQLRTVRINGDWDSYQRFLRQRQHLDLYGQSAALQPPERQALAA